MGDVTVTLGTLARVINADATLANGARKVGELNNAANKHLFCNAYLLIPYDTTAPSAGDKVAELYILADDGGVAASGVSGPLFPQGGDGTLGGDRDPQAVHLVAPFEARNPTTETAAGITGITQANPAVVTDASHGLSIGDVVYISGIVGMTELNDTFNEITAADANTFTLGDVDSSGYTAWSSGGTWWNVDVMALYGIAFPPALCRFVLKNTSGQTFSAEWELVILSYTPTVA